MTPFVLRPFFIRSMLATGLIAGGAFALLASRAAPPPPAECVSAPQPPAEAAASDDSDEGDEVPDHDDTNTYSLVVEESNPACEYFSSFEDDTVELAPGTKLAVFERDFAFEDGCDWKSEERLERLDDETFRYTYHEHAVRCEKGHRAAAACTRTGVVARAIEGD